MPVCVCALRPSASSLETITGSTLAGVGELPILRVLLAAEKRGFAHALAKREANTLRRALLKTERSVRAGCMLARGAEGMSGSIAWPDSGSGHNVIPASIFFLKICLCSVTMRSANNEG